MPFLAKKQDTLFSQIQEHFPEASKNSIKQWLLHGRVSVNSKIVKKGDVVVNAGDKLDLLPKKEIFKENLEILFEDEHLVVINKPVGLLSVAADIETEISAHRLLKQRKFTKGFNKGIIYPVHRIDRETSGILVFAYTELAKNHFKKLFFHHDIKREYVAMVEGLIEKNKGSWKSFLKEDNIGYVYTVKESEDAKEAITHFEKLKEGKDSTLLSLKLETGRKNQIRVQAAKAGHPILGDKKYGSTRDPYKRLMLHAEVLGFIHPITKKPMEFRVAAPAYFNKLV